MLIVAHAKGLTPPLFVAQPTKLSGWLYKIFFRS